ncbi:hypothetical protein WME89_23915 [Sorangium sp. So ce321]|uniref:hypothetical protein n=1 Tax=Sorangium sp. So ce321 TaxID=3133300 RepID=UPI003F60F7E3
MRREALIALAALGLLVAACGSDPGFEGTKAPKVEAARNPDGSIDDRSMCEWKGRGDREASETAGPGAIQPNVRRVWQIVGTGEDRHKALVCREIDTNFDGVKDVVRRYNDKGESLHEESDANYDGRIDTWLTFASGRLAEVRIDSDRDGNPDEWKYYSGGKLARIKRDTNRDGKPDVWEIYRMGRLERMGVDIDADERVDRWDHDSEVRRRVEDDERKKEEEAAAAAAKKAAEDQSAADRANEAADGGGGAQPPGSKK